MKAIVENPDFLNPTFQGIVTFPDQSTWSSIGLNIAAGSRLLFNGVPMGGVCPEGEFINEIDAEGVPSCDVIGINPGPEIGPNPPTNPFEGQLWWNNSVSPPILEVWDGSAWVVVSNETGNNSGPTPPPNPVLGQIWYDTSTEPATLKVWDGTQWVLTQGGGNGLVIGPTAPIDPTDGLLWYDTSVTPPLLRIWDGVAWIVVSNENNSNSGPTPPANPVIGQLWYDTSITPPMLKVWDGTAWVEAHGLTGGPWAPLVNPAGGQNNYAPLANPSFTGTVTINGTAVTNEFAPLVNPTGGQNNYAPISNPNFTGTIMLNGSPFSSGAPGTNPSGGSNNYAPINNPTFTGIITINGTLVLPNGSVLDAYLANPYSGVGLCPTNQYVTGLNRNAGPTCAPVSGITGGTCPTDEMVWQVTGNGGVVCKKFKHEVSEDEPTSPGVGDIWFDKGHGRNRLRIWDGTHWMFVKQSQNENEQ